MDISGLWSLQCMMFILVAAGAVLRKVGVLKAEGKAVLTDAVLYFFLPCNIINSFRMEFDMSILARLAIVLVISVLVQAVCYGLSKVLYNRKPAEVKRVMQYCTIVSNSGFLGLPIAEGIYGLEGMMYASVFIIPMRVMMWSAGIACFTESPDMKSVIKKIAVHPCIVAVYIGLALLIFQAPLAALCGSIISAGGAAGAASGVLLTAVDKAVRSAGGCTTALTMVLIGMMMAEVKASSLFDKNTLLMSAMRLVFLPALTLIGCRLAGIDPFLTGVCVLITGMPAGSTSAILAAKYGCDYMFATRCIVVSTLLSMLSIPCWAMFLA
ncbi:MAG: AEC family transporter [Eubacteriales bacterium]|nr:AEC family transporter [Eubacteriales bacterium]